MPELPMQGIDAPAPNSARLPIADAPPAGASRGGGVADDAARAKRLRALAAEIETLPTTHAAFARLLTVAVESLQGAGAWIGLTMEDTDALVVVASYGDVPVDAGTRVPRDRSFAARALQSKSAIFADPSTGVRWSDTVIARTPVRAVAAPLLVDAEHAVGIISVIGGHGRLFTVADGTFAHELGSLAALILRRRDVVSPAPVIDDATPTPDVGLTTPMLLDAAAALSVDDFAAAVIHRLDDPALLGVSLAVRDRSNHAMRFPAALGALAALRGVRTPLDESRAEHLARQRRAIQMPDARHLVPDGWRSLVPALPGASIALVDNNIAVGRVDVVYDPDRPVPQEVMRRIELLAATVARALSVVQARVARTPTDHGLESLQALRTTLAGRLHDLTSPLAGISALAELMTDEQLSPELHESIALIQRSARRANEVASTLRALTDDAEAFAEPVMIDELIHDILRERGEAQRALTMTVNVTVDPAMPPLPWPASAMRDWLSSAVIASETALLTSSRRRIDIRATIDGAHAVITVADDGVRITNVPSDATLYGASVSVVRTDDGRTIRRLAIPLRIGNSPQAS
jgi:signal transduction histidine kinase